MEKKTVTTLIIKTLISLGVLLIAMSFVSPILKSVCPKLEETTIDCHFIFYFIAGIISIGIALIYAACNTCKCKKEEPNTETPQKSQEEIDREYQKEQQKLRDLREHEERMAIIKALGANYSKKEADALKQKLDEIIRTLNTIKHS